MIGVTASLAAAAVALPAPPVAQRKTEMETGSRVGVPQRARIPEVSGQSAATRGRLVMAQFARCAIDRNAHRLTEVLAKSPNGDFETAARMLVTDECLDSGEVRFKPSALRGPVYTELYRRRALAAAAGKRWGPEIAAIDLSAVATDDTQRQYQTFMTLGDCVVQADPAGSKAVVAASTASAQQDAAITPLMPSLSACLPKDSQVRIGKAALEGILAEVLYRGVRPSVVTPEPAK